MFSINFSIDRENTINNNDDDDDVEKQTNTNLKKNQVNLPETTSASFGPQVTVIETYSIELIIYFSFWVDFWTEQIEASKEWYHC